MTPYRDELSALREENSRLRRSLERSGRSPTLVWTGAGSVVLLSVLALQGLHPALNAPADGTFLAGVGGVVLVLIADAACLLAIFR